MNIFNVSISGAENLSLAQKMTVTMSIQKLLKDLQQQNKVEVQSSNDVRCTFFLTDEKNTLTAEALREKILHVVDETLCHVDISLQDPETIRTETSAPEHVPTPAGTDTGIHEAFAPTEQTAPTPDTQTVMQKIDALIGAEDFKAMARELTRMGSALSALPGFFSRNSYLFSIDDGAGLTTALTLFAELVHPLGLIPSTEITEIDSLTDSSDPNELEQMQQMLEARLRRASASGIVCIDLSKCYDALKRAEYREILKSCFRAKKHLLVFRVPFLESRILNDIEETLNDLFYVHTVPFTPMSLEQLFTCAERSAKSFGFDLTEDMRLHVYDMIAHEKRDGRFYGIKTMDKIVTQLIFEKLNNPSSAKNHTLTANDIPTRPHSLRNELSGEEELKQLIGMEDIVTQVEEIVSLIEYTKKTNKKAPSLHMRFIGPPGTGKTTVARIVAKIFKEHGLLRTGVFFEYTGNDLIAKYVGHTAAKTAQICRDAYGGVLFIDEAYTLADGGPDGHSHGSFREEALNTLLAQMENHRDDMVIIMAGYEQEIDALLQTNPGLAQRMPFVVNFDRYSKEQLADIFFVYCNNQFEVSDDLKQHIRSYFSELPNNIYYSRTFANARFVRNLYERVVSKVALRCRLENASDRVLLESDFDKAVEDIRDSLTSAMTFGQDSSGAVMFSEDTASISFADVCGEDEAKELLSEMIDFLRSPEKYTRIGAEIPKGALLYGPPGTGKTMLARAAASEAHVPVLTLSGSDLTSKFVGEAPEKVRSLFAQARKLAPCIVFIDEIDAIGGMRSGNSNDTALIQLLTEMDGFSASEGIMILAATNQPEALDPALRRPGRLDREIPVELPGLDGRIEILRHYLGHTQNEPEIDLHEVALMASGMSGADLKNVVNEAALRAVREHRTCISQFDLEESIEVVSVGYQKHGSLLSPHEKEVVCYHEIGHALAAALQTHSAPVKKITVLPRTGGILGYARQLDTAERYLYTKTELENRILTIVAGRAAEEVHFHEATTGASDDIQKATRLARRIVTQYGMTDTFDMVGLEHTSSSYLGSSQSMNCSSATAEKIDLMVIEIVREQHRKAIELLRTHEKQLDALAQFICEKETITGEQFMDILQSTPC